MIEGQRYAVQFNYHSGNGRTYQRELVGVYLGYSGQKDEEQFSLRPLFGTTAIRREDIIKSDVTGRKIKAPTRIR